MSQYIASLKRLRQEYLREDAETVISDKSFAQRLLARAGLTRRERMDCFFSAGGRYKSSEIEKVLRFRCARIHEDERPSSSTRSYNRERYGAEDAREPLKRKYGWKRSSRPSASGDRAGRQRRAYWADETDEPLGDLEENPDEEDLEEEFAAGHLQEPDDQEAYHKEADDWRDYEYHDYYHEYGDDEDDEWEGYTTRPPPQPSCPRLMQLVGGPSSSLPLTGRPGATSRRRAAARASGDRIVAAPMTGRRTAPAAPAGSRATGAATPNVRGSRAARISFTRSIMVPMSPQLRSPICPGQ